MGLIGFKNGVRAVYQGSQGTVGYSSIDLIGEKGRINLGLLNNPPHPNAAQLFCNWMATPAGMGVYLKAINYASPLKTLKSDWMPDYQTPKPGIDYIDTYDWKYTQETYPAHFEAVRKALGAS